MKRGFYAKIALGNLQKNARLYVPRILAETGLLGSFYILFTLALDERLADVLGGSYLPTFMAMGAIVIGLLSLILILYINSFLMKQRKSEYGLYNVLGMEKRHIIRVLFCESLAASLLSVVLGLLFGTLFYKMSSLLICRLLRSEIVAGFYYLSAPTILYSAGIFLGIDLLAFAKGSAAVCRLKPVELLGEKHAGEREPKIKWAILLLGVLALGAGYYISLTTKNPLEAIFWFFAAVILVIVGTYCLFVTGTTFVLKSLKGNRRYYYDKKHMSAVAGLLFRMKRNAVGLASIAILSTGVLLLVSTTVSLYCGVQDVVDTNYPCELYLSAYQTKGEDITQISAEELGEIVAAAAEENGVAVQSVELQQMLAVPYMMRDGKLLTKAEDSVGWNEENLTGALYITERAYEELRGKKVNVVDPAQLSLAEDEIALCRISTTINNIGDVPQRLTIHGKEYRVREVLSYFPVSHNMGTILNVLGIVVADEAVLQEIYLAQKQDYGSQAAEYANRIGVRFADEEAVSAIGSALEENLAAKLHAAYPDDVSYTLDTKWRALTNVLELYGTFLFLGILLGFVCLFSTILIIYYKQISEGYEDRDRFQIMQKIGMEAQEVKAVIGSQLVLQFFLPLATAALHTAMAFPILLKLLQILMLSNTLLFVLCTVITFAVFALVYGVVYRLTAKTYYKIVH